MRVLRTLLARSGRVVTTGDDPISRHRRRWRYKSGRSATHRYRRLSLESLEWRWCRALVTWDGEAGDNLWSTAGNWSTNALPGSTDDVEIQAGASVTILHSGGVDTVHSLRTTAARLRLTGGEIRLSGSSELGGPLSVEGGILAGHDVTLLHGDNVWAGGQLQDVTLNIATAGQLRITGNNPHTLDHATVHVAGTAIYEGTGSLFQGEGSALEISSTGLFDVRNDMFLPDGTSNDPLVIRNQGVLRKSAGTGATTILAPLFNTGRVEVQSGRFVLTGGGTSGGTFSALAGTEIWVNQTGTFSDGVRFVGSGATRLTGGTSTFQGNVIADQLLLDGATASGQITVIGALTWLAGRLGNVALTVPPPATLTLTGNNPHSLDHATVHVAGTAIYEGIGSLFQGEGSAIEISSTGLFDVRNDLFLPDGASNDPLVIRNQGVLRKSAGTGATTILAPLFSTGRVEVQSGRLVLTGGGTSGGTFTTLAGTEIWVNQTGTFSDGVRFVGSGATRLTGGTSTFQGNVIADQLLLDGATVSGQITVIGALTWLAGRLGNVALTVPPPATLTLTGSGAKHLDHATLHVAGTAIYDGSGSLFQGEGSALSVERGGLLDIRTVGAFPDGSSNDPLEFQNAGTVRKSVGQGTTSLIVPFDNGGSVELLAGTLQLNSLSFGDQGYLSTSTGTRLLLSGDLQGTTTSLDEYQANGLLEFQGGNAAQPRLLEVMSRDRGPVSRGFAANGAYGSIALSSAYVRLTDLADNAPGGEPDALYVGDLSVPAGSTLDLHGSKVYARSARVAGTVLGGTIQLVPDGGPLEYGVPTVGRISAPGEADTWTLVGRQGQGLTLEIRPGAASPPAPPPPALELVHVQLLNESGELLEEWDNAANGAGTPLQVIGRSLPADGLYRLRVSAASASAGATGHYLLTAWTGSLETLAGEFNEVLSGRISIPGNVQRWVFPAEANQRVQLRNVHTAGPEIRFSFTGPSGESMFSELPGDSELLVLPSDGEYTLTVDGPAGLAGAYAFQLNRFDVTDLTLGTPHRATLPGMDAGQLFRLNVPTADPLRLRLTVDAAASGLEMYARFGIPPTRAIHDANDMQGGDATPLLIPKAYAGTWYVLVYGAGLTGQVGYELVAETLPVAVERITPDQAGDQTAFVLTVEGAGFLPGTTVDLIDEQGHVFAAPAVTIESYERLTVPLAAGSVLPGTYDVRVRTAAGAQVVQPEALTIVAGGTPRLETRLVVPASLGRHANAVVYVEYANTGSSSLAAPVLTLESSDPDGSDRPLFTLDSADVSEGFWTSAVPDGFSHSVNILAGGSEPGLLHPGESRRIPVYYVGLQQPWDFSDSRIELQLNIHGVDDPTPIDWTGLTANLLPTSMSAPAWQAIVANLQTQIGTTWGDYVRMLDDNATYLGTIGAATADVAALWDFEVEQANGLLTELPVLELSDDLPGIDSLLEGLLQRQFGSTVESRWTLGPWGWGWYAPWQMSLQTAADGSVSLFSQPGSVHRWQPDSRDPQHYFSLTEAAGELIRRLDGGYERRASDGMIWRFDAAGRLVVVQQPTGQQVTLAYSEGRVVSLTSSTGGTVNLTYTAAGRVASLTDSQGRHVVYEYDDQGSSLLRVSDGTGRETRYAYGTDGSQRHTLLRIESTEQPTRHFTYDSEGRLASTFGDGGTETVGFERNRHSGQLSLRSGAMVTRLDYDLQWRLRRLTVPSGSATTWTYDDEGHLVAITDAAGNSARRLYDSRGRLIQLTDQLGNATRLAYNTEGRMVAVTDARDQTRRFSYAPTGQIATVTYPDGSVERFSYATNGSVAAFSNRRGQTIHYETNAAGQITRQTLPDGQVTEFQYDARGNRLSVTDASGTTLFAYDVHDRLTQVTYPQARSLHYEYDAAGRLIRLQDQDGSGTRYEYDPWGRLHQVALEDGTVFARLSYDLLGRLIRRDDGNGHYVTWDYDQAGRLQQITQFDSLAAIQTRLAYGYNAAGLRSSLVTPDGGWTYEYDALGQLVGAMFASTNPLVPNQDLHYAYDAVGNRVRTVSQGQVTEYQANALDEYTRIGDRMLAYDTDGNLVAEYFGELVTAYRYDAWNRLVEVRGPHGTQQYEYDALGHLTAMVDDGERFEYLVDPSALGQTVATFDSAGQRIASFVPGTGLLGNRDATGRPAYFTADVLGSIVATADVDGALSGRTLYGPYGELIWSSDTVSQPFGFVGQWQVRQEASGLDFMRARFYAPQDGRFLSVDPLRNEVISTNLYAYAANSPIQFIDPSGESFIDSWVDEILKPLEPNRGCSDRGDISEQGAALGLAACRQEDPLRRRKDPIFPPCPNGNCGGGSGGGSVPAAVDPNQLVGPAGTGPDHHILAESWLPYRIDIENDSQATAPAQEVLVTNQLSSDLDWTTLEFSAVGFGDLRLTVPPSRQHFRTSLPLFQGDVAFQVDVSLDFDPATGRLAARFNSVLPESGLPPDVFTGFLPPEDGTGRGQAYVSYLVRAKAGVPDGTVIRNVALIEFDRQGMIATNQRDPHDPRQGTDPAREAPVTIDAAPPSSQVEPLTDPVLGRTFTVTWKAADSPLGSGVDTVDIFVSTDGGAFVPWLMNSTLSSAEFAGAYGHTYAFYSRARDRVGYQENAPLQADTRVQTVNRAPTGLRQSVLTVSENSPAGTIVGTLLAADDDTGEQFTWELLDSADQRFQLVGDELRVAAGGVLDWETNRQFTVNVRVTDAGDSTWEGPLSIQLTDANDRPSGVRLASTHVAENVSGAGVGDLLVDDDDQGDEHTWEWSDARFVRSNNQLALADGQFVSLAAGGVIELEVTVRDNGTPPLAFTQVLTITVDANPFPWHNTRVPLDVTGDGHVFPVDALVVINELNSPQIAERNHLPAVRPASESRRFDTDANGLVIPIDALLIINFINEHGASEGESQELSPARLLPDPAVTLDGTATREVADQVFGEWPVSLTVWNRSEPSAEGAARRSSPLPRLASAPAQQGASVIAKEEAGLAGIVLPRFGGHVVNAAELLDECWAELGNSTGRGLEPNEARRLDDSGSTTAARQ